MKKIKLAWRVMIVLCLLIGGGFVWMQPNWAQNRPVHDCELQRWNNFLAANDTYSSAFNLWYRDDPTSCHTVCTQQCQNILDYWDQLGCYLGCMNTCQTTRENAYFSAQDSLINAANQTCSYNPDYCDAARARRDECNWNWYNAYQNPVLNENNEIDGTWQEHVDNEFYACFAASGIHLCE